ncbi:MAG: MBOAT family O-acyltransferase, partial [Campylobacterota bacterium]|nr:MBOAT family O-acyltransferase [Campylobacterota bacterium]
MLFNSYSFIFLFLLPVVGIFFLLKPVHRLGFLILASLIFYAQWSMAHLGLLIASILFNYLSALLMMRSSHKRTILTLAILGNLSPLIYFKYSLFLHLSTQSLLLPLAISFYTFQQIAFLVDLYREKITRGTFREYLFFVIFFPQLIAGPIVHYRQIITQVRDGALESARWHYIHRGILLFSMGLFKKIVLADQFFPIANSAFGHVGTLSSLEAWVGLFAYSFGIYFDFSAYTDMAIGLALLFGLRLPINFDSPYKAVNIIDFWRRWHITLSDFLRDYIYIPLGGNRRGEYREVFNLIVTMTLGGIWHGAGWTFLLWGLLHGLLLSIVHLKNRYLLHWKIPDMAAIVITFISVSLLWVLFRSESVEEAEIYYEALFDFGKADLPAINLYGIAIGLGIVWLLPNSIEFSGYRKEIRLGWRYALVAALLSFMALKMMAEAPAQTFVYFNF